MAACDELNLILGDELRRATDAGKANAEEAKARRDLGDVPGALDASLEIELPDILWARADWDAARREFRRSANLLEERRDWNRHHSGADYPLDASSDWEAATLIKAGRLHEGRHRVVTALAYWEQMPDPENVLLRLAMHAAQAGDSESSRTAETAATPHGRALGDIRNVNRLSLYAPAQCHLLLGDWSAFEYEVERMNQQIEALCSVRDGQLSSLDNAVAAAARGFTAMRDLRADPSTGNSLAEDAFESAMLDFYRSAGRVTSDMYFMRLNTLLAEQLAHGKRLDPNPFAADSGWR